MPILRPILLGLLVAPLLAACSGGGGGSFVLPAAIVSVTGTWSGGWTEHALVNPMTGQVTLEIVQVADGSVTGTATFTNIPCVTAAPFTGQVASDVLLGDAAIGDVSISFIVGAEDAQDPGSEDLGGVFEILTGAGCTLFRAGFIAPLVVIPLVQGEARDDEPREMHVDGDSVYVLRGDVWTHER